MSHVLIVETPKSYVDHLNSVREANKGVKYVLPGVSGDISKSAIVFSCGFGSAMWIVDFHLHSMSQGIHQVMNTMRPVAKHSFW